jgi:hypothetical protein
MVGCLIIFRMKSQKDKKLNVELLKKLGIELQTSNEA